MTAPSLRLPDANRLISTAQQQAGGSGVQCRRSASWQAQHMMPPMVSCHVHRFPHSPGPVSPQHPVMQAKALASQVEVQRQLAGSVADAFSWQAQLQAQDTDHLCAVL